MDAGWAAIVGAAVGASVAIVQAILSYRERKETRREQVLVSALSYLDGGSQRRSIGLSLIEGMFARGEAEYAVVLPALTNQAVYLLLHAASADKRHEMHNWLRIMKLIGDPEVLAQKYPDCYGELANALVTRLEGHDGGLEMTETTLRLWRDQFPKFGS